MFSHAFPPTQRYAPLKELGAGGMGAVFLVRDNTSGAQVALKTILEPDADNLLRFKREFRIAADLNHPHLVRLYDLVAEGKHWFYTMELVEGVDVLRALRPQGMVSPDDTTTPVRRTAGAEHGGADIDLAKLRRVGAQIASALDFLHQRGVVHRDIKPQNIYVDVDGNARVMDFGLANRSSVDLKISASNIIVGTLSYLAPELLAGKPATPSSDLYALGVILFQALTGRMPFFGAASTTLSQRQSEDAPRVRSFAPHTPADIADIVDLLLAREPGARPTAAEVRAAWGRAGPASDAAAPSREFVGRDDELQQLTAALDVVDAGGSATVWIEGPSGIGKSALVEQLMHVAQERGFRALAGRCYERERVPLIAFDRVVDALVLVVRAWPFVATAGLRPELRRLAGTFPVVELLVASEDESSPRPPREQRQAVIDALGNVIEGVAAAEPLVVVLDDLHWADEDSLVMLEHLVRRRMPRVLLVGLLRSNVLGDQHRLSRLMAADDEGLHVRLSGLSAADVARLGTAAGVDDRSWVDAIFAESQGNPLLVQAWAEHAARAADGRAPSISAVFRDAFARLTPPATRLLHLLATAGSDVDLALLGDVSGLDATELERGLRELMSERLVVRLPGDPPRVDFSHDRWREVSYAALPEEARAALHAELAAGLEKLAAPTLRDVEALVRHWGVVGDAEKRRTFTRAAAERAEKQLLWRRAAELHRAQLEADHVVDADAWEHVGDLFEWSSAHADALAAYDRAFAAVGTHERGRRLRLLSRLSEHALAVGHIERATELSRDGLALLGVPLDRSLPMRVFHIGQLTARMELRRRTPAPVSAVEDPRVEEMRFFRHTVRTLFLVSILAAAECDRRAALLGFELGDADGRFRALAGTAATEVFGRRLSPQDVQLFRRRLDEAEVFAREHGLRSATAFVQHNRAMLWMLTDTDRAISASSQALEMYEQQGLSDTLDGISARMFHLLLLALTGRYDEARSLAEEALSGDASVLRAGSALAILVRLEADRGNVDGALAAQARYRALVGKKEPLIQLSADMLVSEVVTMVADGRYREALAFAGVHESRMRAMGAHLSRLQWGLWNIELVEAGLRLAVAGDRGTLGEAERRARWVEKRGVLSYESLGSLGLARVAHARGDIAGAQRMVRALLERTHEHTMPYVRWRVLDAARAFGVATAEGIVEEEQLRARHLYRLPAPLTASP